MKLSCGRWKPALLALIFVLSFAGVPVASQDTATPDTVDSGPGVVFGAFPEGTQEGVYFEEFVEPGDTHEFRLAVRNGGTDPLALLIYPADAYSMVNGGMGVNFQQEARSEPTTWLDFPEGEIGLAPGEESVQPFTVSVPEGTLPGQYVAAIGVETAGSFTVGEEGGAFRQKLRKVVAVSILVPGDANPSFVLGEPEAVVARGQTVLRVPVENTGNVRVRPTGTVILTDAQGQEVASGEVSMGSVYLGNTAPFEIWLPNALPPGEYRISVDLTDPDTGASATLENVAVQATPEPDVESTPSVVRAATPVPVEPVTVQSIEIAANSEEIQFANIAFDLENTGNYLTQTRVTLAVRHNGELVEEFVIDDNLPLPVGTTSVADRYIPPTGWESGTWTFAITIHSITGNDNVETVVVSEEDVATIEVP